MTPLTPPKTWKDYALHIMLGIVMTMTGMAWNTMAARVDQLDTAGSRADGNRIVVTETQLRNQEREIRDMADRQQRIEDKLDQVLSQIRTLPR